MWGCRDQRDRRRHGEENLRILYPFRTCILNPIESYPPHKACIKASLSLNLRLNSGGLGLPRTSTSSNWVAPSDSGLGLRILGFRDGSVCMV